MARTSYQSKHHTSSNAAEQTRFQHHKCKKIFTMNVNYQFVESLKRHQSRCQKTLRNHKH